jgi:hypothetical protein
MSSEGIKPGHTPLSEVPPEPGPQGSPASFSCPVVPIPDLTSSPRRTVPVVVYYLALLVIVPAGVLVGGRGGYRIEPAFPLGAQLSMLLLVAGIVLTANTRPIKDQTGKLIVSVLVVGYCAMSTVVDPFLYMSREPGVERFIVPLVCLVPILLGGMWLARRGCWLQALGAALFVFVSLMLLSFNVNYGLAGFFQRIRE